MPKEVFSGVHAPAFAPLGERRRGGEEGFAVRESARLKACPDGNPCLCNMQSSVVLESKKQKCGLRWERKGGRLLPPQFLDRPHVKGDL
jgi:hypothetical protein